jgi:cryptochrome
MPPKSSKDNPRVIYWFRTDLRLHDSPALTAALALNPTALFPIWTWDPHYVYHSRVGPNRWRFLTECQLDLSTSLTKLNPKQKLFLIREGPETILPKLFKKWRISHLVFEKDTDAYAHARDERVCQLAREAGVELVVKTGRTLFDPDELVRNNNGKPTMSISQVQKASAKIGDGMPVRPLEAPTTLPDPGTAMEMDLRKLEHERPGAEPDFNAVFRSKREGQYANIIGPNGDFAIPTLEEMGISPNDATTPHRGGESIALKMLADYCNDSDYIGTFEKPKTAPTAFSPQSTTLLSPHLHFGSLSVRKYWWDVQTVIERRKKAKKPNTDIPVNLPGQLLFRDMYFGAQTSLGHAFAQTQGNKIARFIDWHLQSNYGATPVGEHLLDITYTVDNPAAEIWFQRWKAGTTGFPWIDALMRQLRQEGWIHHLGRHAVACFLTRGGCYVHWERGAEVFEEWLIDHETACNVGNWMWLSCTAFYAMFYRVYSPVAFPKKWDVNGEYVRKYVPELKEFDKKYIYEPHKAPVVDQRRWGCLVKGDGGVGEEGGTPVYPKPMFDFSERRQICIDKIKNAYNVGLHGNDEKVMNGEWKKVFNYEDESGEAKKDEMNGLIVRGKKRREPEYEGAEDDEEGKTNGARKTGKSSATAAKGLRTDLARCSRRQKEE